MSISYEYNEAEAVKADNAASRISEQGPYVGKFTKAEAIESKGGTHGIAFTFDSPGCGTVEFSLYTQKSDGAVCFGMNFVQAAMFLMGVKSLKASVGKVSKWSETEGKRVEEDGDVFPDLCGKPIGIVLAKELITTGKGNDSARFNLEGLFQAETRLMMSEIKEKKTTPVKLDRLVKGLKVKDSRTKVDAQPAQPAIGAAAGDY